MIGFPYLRLGVYQRLDPDLTGIAALGTAANKMLYTTAVDTWAEANLTVAGRAILDDATAAIQATTLGLGTGSTVQFAALKLGTANLETGALFELAKAAANAHLVISCYHDTEATTALITLRKADNTEAAPALIDDNAVLGTIHFDGYDGTGWHTGAKIEVRANGDPSDGTDMPAEISFWTCPNASATLAQRVTILANGNVGIGEATPAQTLVIRSAGPLIQWSVAGANAGYMGNAGNLFGAPVVHNDLGILSANHFWIGTNNGGKPRLTVLESGNVGIAVDAPAGNFCIGDRTEGETASLNIQTAHETHTLAGAGTSDTTTISIPSGATLLGVSFCVNTAVSDDDGDDTWSAAFITGSTATLGTAEAAAQNTKVNTLIVPEISTDVCQIRFTANGSNFTAGVIEIVAYYIDLTSLANV